MTTLSLTPVQQAPTPATASPVAAVGLVGPGKNIDRDRWGRPLITPPHGGTPVAYTRCTTYVGSLDDKENLMKWKARMTAIGIAARPDLILKLKATDPDDKTTLGKIAEEAAEHAGAHQRAEIGTQLHALTERLDRGETLPDLGEWQKDIDAYQQALASYELTPVEIETFVVNDNLKIGGTFDRIFELGGRKYIGDLKTGSTVDWGAGTYAMQLAVYANSVRYDHETGQRAPLDVDTSKAILIHLPAGEGRATVYWIDIARGWQSVSLATAVRQWRRLRKNDWLTEIGTDPEPAKSTVTSIDDYIAMAQTVQDLQNLYRNFQTVWTDRHTALAAARKASLTPAGASGSPQ